MRIERLEAEGSVKKVSDNGTDDDAHEDLLSESERLRVRAPQSSASAVSTSFDRATRRAPTSLQLRNN